MGRMLRCSSFGCSLRCMHAASLLHCAKQRPSILCELKKSGHIHEGVRSMNSYS